MDEATAAAWQSASNSVQNAAGVIATGSLNKKTRAWNDEKLLQQRGWALEDRDYANQYNSPAMVMARAKAAGINPMYAATNGNVITASSPVRSADAMSWHPQVPDFKQDNSIGSMYGLQLMEAQLNNARAQTMNINADTAMKVANTRNLGVTSDIKDFDLGVKKILQSTMIGQEIAKLAGLETQADVNRERATNIFVNTTKQSYETQFMRDENLRREAMNSANIGQAVERVLLMQKQGLESAARTQHTYLDMERMDNSIKLMQQDQQLKQFIIELNKSNLTPQDPTWLRIVDGILKYLSK